MNRKTAFALGPMASPLLILVFSIFISIVSGSQDGVIGFIKTTAVFFFVSLAYSYIFSIIFGLPVYLYFIKKEWLSWFSFNAGALVSTALLGIFMLITKQDKLDYLLPVLFFAIVNANLMWYLIHKTANPSFKRDA